MFIFIFNTLLAAVAGAFSIFGLVAIYPASAIGVMIGASRDMKLTISFFILCIIVVKRIEALSAIDNQ